MIFSRQKKNVLVLAVGQALNGINALTLLTLSGLVGYALSPDKSLATIPVTTTVLGTALVTVPASFFMRRVGRRIGFMTGTVFGLVGGGICSYAILTGSFLLFCLGTPFFGGANAFAQYYRFAAADAADESFKSRAISYVLAGGIVAALVGAEIVQWSKDFFLPVNFLGAYMVTMVISLVACLILSQTDIPNPAKNRSGDTGRPLLEIMRQPVFMVSVVGGMIAYGVMNIIMTSGPLAMVAHGFIVNDAIFVVQWHILGMFAPSFITGSLIARYGILNIMLCGCALLAACGIAALSGFTLMNFWLAMTLVGLGWNFTFISATTLLTETYRPAEQAKTQAANDFLIFLTMATTSFLSGNLMHYLGWVAVNVGAFPFILVCAGAALWLIFRRRKDAGARAPG